MKNGNDVIVAVELGSSSIRAIAGRRLPNGNIEVIGLADEPAQNCIHKGAVENIEKTTQAIASVIARLDLVAGGHIKSVYVGLGGQSLHSRKNSVKRQFPEVTQITSHMVDMMLDSNYNGNDAGYNIHEVVQQESLVGNRQVEDPVGMQAETIEARFLNVVARAALEDNIRKCVKGAGLNVADILVSPLMLADAVLRPDEKRSGCAVVDIGAETTTITVYTKNILRHLIVLPIGGANVTQDIAAQKIEWDEAEMLKLKHGTAYRNDTVSDEETIELNYGQKITTDKLLNIIEARYEEIVANAWHQIKPYSDLLLSGQVVLTGGASRAKNLVPCFQFFAQCNKQVKIFKGLPDGIVTSPNVIIPEDGRYLTLMGLLLHGDQNCLASKEPEKPKEEPVPVQPEEPAVANMPVEPATVEPEKPAKEDISKKESWWKNVWKKVQDGLSEPE